MAKIMFGDIPCWHRTFKMSRVHSNTPKHVCPMCRKQIKSDEEVYLFVNNYKLFPNSMVHTECVEKECFDLIDCVKYLTSAYKEAYKLWPQAFEGD